MLFTHFTWQQFLIAATILTAVWYLFVTLVFYRKKIQEFFKARQHRDILPEPLKHSWQDDYEDEAAEEGDDVIGKAALPEGMSKVSMHMFGFAPPPGEDEQGKGWTMDNTGTITDDGYGTTDERREEQQGIVPDVMAELKNIFFILESDQGGKEQLLSLLAPIRSKYAAIRDTPAKSALNEFIRASVLFPLSEDELNNLWN